MLPKTRSGLHTNQKRGIGERSAGKLLEADNTGHVNFEVPSGKSDWGGLSYRTVDETNSIPGVMGPQSKHFHV